MKNILKYILCCAFCVGVIFTTTTTVNAEDIAQTDRLQNCATIDITNGVSYYFHLKMYNSSQTYPYTYQLANDRIWNQDSKLCLYLTPGEYELWLRPYQALTIPSYQSKDSYETATWFFDNSAGIGLTSTNVRIDLLETNIPIFSSKEEAKQYVNGNISISSALNYKKTYINGSWVRPFEDIEINDSNILVPKLSNVSHNGFTVTNNNGMYMLDVYVDSGIQDVQKYLDNSSDINNPLYSNSFGLVSNNTEVAYDGVSGIDMMSMFGVDNVSALQENLVDFFATYPSVLDYQNNTNYVYQRDDFTSASPCFFDIWGKWLGKTYMFWRTNHDVLSSDIDLTAVNGVPLCYTHYRVRFYYYDENDGMHYGPWSNVVYFSGGRVSSSAIFQDNNGNIVESTVDNGVQDENGNIGFTNTEILDLNNSNSLFAYIRSAINNVNATGNNFMTLFASVFSFIPAELQLALWLGVGTMILIGVIKALRG